MHSNSTDNTDCLHCTEGTEYRSTEIIPFFRSEAWEIARTQLAKNSSCRLNRFRCPFFSIGEKCAKTRPNFIVLSPSPKGEKSVCTRVESCWVGLHFFGPSFFVFFHTLGSRLHCQKICCVQYTPRTIQCKKPWPAQYVDPPGGQHIFGGQYIGTRDRSMYIVPSASRGSRHAIYIDRTMYHDTRHLIICWCGKAPIYIRPVIYWLPHGVNIYIDDSKYSTPEAPICIAAPICRASERPIYIGADNARRNRPSQYILEQYCIDDSMLRSKSVLELVWWAVLCSPPPLVYVSPDAEKAQNIPPEACAIYWKNDIFARFVSNMYIIVAKCYASLRFNTSWNFNIHTAGMCNVDYIFCFRSQWMSNMYRALLHDHDTRNMYCCFNVFMDISTQYTLKGQYLFCLQYKVWVS